MNVFETIEGYIISPAVYLVTITWALEQFFQVLFLYSIHTKHICLFTLLISKDHRFPL